MPILVETEPEWVDAIRPTLPAYTQVTPTTADVDFYLTEQSDHYAVVIGPNIDLDDATALAAKLRHSHPTTGLILLRHLLDTSTYEAAMAAGIPAVVSANDPHALSAATERAREFWQAVRTPVLADTREGRVVAVFSPKGGVGKTTVTVNLAMALAREHGARVCIVDMDLAYGDIAITLQLIPEHTIYEAAGAEDQLDYTLIEPLLTRHPDCMILAAPTHSEGRLRIAPALVGEVLRVLRQEFDVVLVDNAPAFDPHVTEVILEADTVVMIATLDVPTIKNVKMALETMDGMGVPASSRLLVLNRADDAVGLSGEHVEGLLKMPISARLPSEIAVASGTNQGTPLVAGSPDHPVSRQLIELGRQLLPTHMGQPEPAAPSTDDRPTRRGLFGRRGK